jgi:hypothetical protein
MGLNTTSKQMSQPFFDIPPHNGGKPVRSFGNDQFRAGRIPQRTSRRFLHRDDKSRSHTATLGS